MGAHAGLQQPLQRRLRSCREAAVGRLRLPGCAERRGPVRRGRARAHRGGGRGPHPRGVERALRLLHGGIEAKALVDEEDVVVCEAGAAGAACVARHSHSPKSARCALLRAVGCVLKASRCAGLRFSALLCTSSTSPMDLGTPTTEHTTPCASHSSAMAFAAALPPLPPTWRGRDQVATPSHDDKL
jgi:hypothetical protein